MKTQIGEFLRWLEEKLRPEGATLRNILGLLIAKVTTDHKDLPEGRPFGLEDLTEKQKRFVLALAAECSTEMVEAGFMPDSIQLDDVYDTAKRLLLNRPEDYDIDPNTCLERKPGEQRRLLMDGAREEYATEIQVQVADWYAEVLGPSTEKTADPITPQAKFIRRFWKQITDASANGSMKHFPYEAMVALRSARPGEYRVAYEDHKLIGGSEELDRLRQDALAQLFIDMDSLDDAGHYPMYVQDGRVHLGHRQMRGKWKKDKATWKTLEDSAITVHAGRDSDRCAKHVSEGAKWSDDSVQECRDCRVQVPVASLDQAADPDTSPPAEVIPDHRESSPQLTVEQEELNAKLAAKAAKETKKVARMRRSPRRAALKRLFWSHLPEYDRKPTLEELAKEEGCSIAGIQHWLDKEEPRLQREYGPFVDTA
ncbi:MAG: hypothetical protein O7H41_16095 [Planctomycetota bacterium]|nr:hypothetical protein [Planctomycetota bacterium]